MKIQSTAFGGFGGGGSTSTSTSSVDDDEYHEVTEDDIGQLAKILGGA